MSACYQPGRCPNQALPTIHVSVYLSPWAITCICQQVLKKKKNTVATNANTRSENNEEHNGKCPSLPRWLRLVGLRPDEM